MNQYHKLWRPAIHMDEHLEKISFSSFSPFLVDLFQNVNHVKISFLLILYIIIRFINHILRRNLWIHEGKKILHWMSKRDIPPSWTLQQQPDVRVFGTCYYIEDYMRTVFQPSSSRNQVYLGVLDDLHEELQSNHFCKVI